MQAVWYLQTVNGTTINLDLSITAWYNLVTIEVGAIQRMQQYFENREFIKAENITGEQNKNKRHENIILANERIDKNWNSENYKINNSTFAKMGLRGAKFSNDDLRFNVFIDCYFKKACFDNVNFTSSIFINCNFDEITLINCTFDYCRFEGCFIEYSDLLPSLSKRPNIRWELCKNLSIECLNLGNEKEYRNYFFEEKKASEEYYWKKFWHKGNDKYYKKYNAMDQLSGLWNFILSKANKFLWGYGEKLTRLLFNVVLVHIVFIIGYYFSIRNVSEEVEMTWGIASYMSLSNFFTVTCDYTPDGLMYKILSVAEGGIGIVLMGFFVAALFRYINRRG
ncbi:MAG: hypothetical protein HFJ01_13595 [Lachnospiraceae bacterium]|nr:hypothetical protein [Lachnospiraceae bacterium]